MDVLDDPASAVGRESATLSAAWLRLRVST